jgi:predicted histidine transporter YuiF (NhaC family)
MLRHLPTPLGIGFIFAGLSVLTSARTAVLAFAGLGVVLGLLVAVAAARWKRSTHARSRRESEELSDWRRFAAGRRRSAPWESALYVLIAGALIWLDGLRLGTILIATGFGLLLAARWFVEPRIWAEVTRRLAAPRT